MGKKQHVFIIVVLFVVAILTYFWTVNLPVIGDGLMHMSDNMDVSNPFNFIKCFFTYNGIGKPDGSATLQFHRPLFDEVIVEILKRVTAYNIWGIRLITLIVFGVAVCISYFMAKTIFKDEKKAIVYALLINFSMTYISGMYEFGLSFSVWLLLNIQLAFVFTYKYEEEGKWYDLVLSLAWTLLTMFTKETAMTLGVAMAFYVFATELKMYRKLTKKIWLFGFLQALITLVYLTSRYLKLGSLFTAAAGLDTSITLFWSIEKIIGFFLYALNIPNVNFYDYMCAYFNSSYPMLALFMMIVPIIIIIRLIRLIYKKDTRTIDFIIYFVMFLVIILPVFKVNRNSTNYGDILTPFILLGVLSIFDFNKKEDRWLGSIYLSIYMFLFVIAVNDTTKVDSGHYLSIQSNESTVIRNELRKINNEIHADLVLQADTWKTCASNIWTYNHNGTGGFYKFNVDNKKTVDMLNSDNIGREAAIVDFFQVEGAAEWQVFYYEDGDECTDVIRIAFDPNNEDTIRVRFTYGEKTYSREYTVAGKSSWSQESNLYLVLPSGCDLSVEGNVLGMEILYQ